MKPVNRHPKPYWRPNQPESAPISGTKKPQKVACFTWDVKANLTTADLGVPGVEVVSETNGKAFAGPFYSDQIELLRDTLRGMPRREKHVVVSNEGSLWIFRKPSKP